MVCLVPSDLQLCTYRHPNDCWSRIGYRIARADDLYVGATLLADESICHQCTLGYKNAQACRQCSIDQHQEPKEMEYTVVARLTAILTFIIRISLRFSDT